MKFTFTVFNQKMKKGMSTNDLLNFLSIIIIMRKASKQANKAIVVEEEQNMKHETEQRCNPQPNTQSHCYFASASKSDSEIQH
jgi:hypothetical protein